MKSLIQSMLRPLGLRLTRLESVAQPDYGLSVLFSTLKRFGFSPRHILDVGANHGNWTRTAITYFPDAEYTLLEPQDHLKVHIQDLIGAGHKIRWINAGRVPPTDPKRYRSTSLLGMTAAPSPRPTAIERRLRQLPFRSRPAMTWLSFIIYEFPNL
jgi:hypothetical protein